MRHRNLFGCLIATLGLLVALSGCNNDPPARDFDPDLSGDTAADGGDVTPPMDGSDDGGDTADGAATDAADSDDGGSDGGDAGDTSGDSGDTTGESCNYDDQSVGVCSEATLGGDGNCQEPDNYEGDESSCDDLDNDCDGTVDENCGCEYDGNSEGVCSDSTRSDDGSCQQPENYESREASCDDLDNDCDGTTDEGCSCDYDGSSDGVCGQATKDSDGTCLEPADYENDESLCDAKDNDCDGDVDEGCSCTTGTTESCYTGPSGTAGTGICESGTRMCQNQSWGTCEGETTPEEETCDEEDNDCDGTVDEGCSCDYDETSEGVCSDGTTGPNGNCNAPGDYEEEESSCDGLDNDCDGTVDEGCFCNYDDTADGVCSNATIGEDGTCQEPEAYESDETSCDGKDNDCDGTVDENCSCDPGETESCYSGPSETAGTGVCEEGSRTCDSDGTWGTCSGETTPSNESCDGKDNDCDGSTDEGCTCNYNDKSMGVCKDQTTDSDGECTEPENYESSESTCGDGLDNDCDGATDCADDDCTDETCNGSGSACQSGDAICHEVACTDGDDNDGDNRADACDPNDCSGESCGSGSQCRADGCVELKCNDGTDNDNDGDEDCEDDDCTRRQCGNGKICCPGGDSCETPRKCAR